MPFTDREGPLNSTGAEQERPPPLATIPAPRSYVVRQGVYAVAQRAHAAAQGAYAETQRAAGPNPVDPDERPTDPAPPVHSFWIPKFPKDPGLPDVARLYREALDHVRAVEASDVPGHSTFRPAPVLRHRYRPARLPKSG